MADGHSNEHDYHIIEPSPWPLLGSIAVLAIALGAIVWMRSLNGEALFGMEGPTLFFLGFAALSVIAFLWWRDIIMEAYDGHHTPVVQLHLRYGMILFIASEVMFFVAWFWAYFDVALFPDATWTMQIFGEGGPTAGEVQIGNQARENVLGGQWPPVASDNFDHTFDPWGLPLVNTLVLLLSGTTVTWAHHALLHNDRQGLIWGLALTVFLGIFFTFLQAYEYTHAAFSYSGHIYGATFFMATGFHGAHVVIGTIFLAVCLFRAMGGAFTPKEHFGFEAAAWYWHFVDVVWLFLFMAIYVWGA